MLRAPLRRIELSMRSAQVRHAVALQDRHRGSKRLQDTAHVRKADHRYCKGRQPTASLRQRINSEALCTCEAFSRRAATAQRIKAAETLGTVRAAPIRIARAHSSRKVAHASLRAVVWTILCRRTKQQPTAQLADAKERWLAHRAVEPRVARVADAEPAAPVAVAVLPRAAVVLSVVHRADHPRAPLLQWGRQEHPRRVGRERRSLIDAVGRHDRRVAVVPHVARRIRLEDRVRAVQRVVRRAEHAEGARRRQQQRHQPYPPGQPHRESATLEASVQHSAPFWPMRSRDPPASSNSTSAMERDGGKARAGRAWFAKDYEPLRAGSVDGSDAQPHDRALVRAQRARFDASKDPKIGGDPFATLFVARLSFSTTEETLRRFFEQFGGVKSLRLVRDVVTQRSKGYAFVEFADERDFKRAYRRAHRQTIDGAEILVDYERARVMKGWKPRRLGGGLGGRKESGQLRFGGRDRPFRPPLQQQQHQQQHQHRQQEQR